MAQTFKIENGDIVVSNVTGRPVTISGSDKLLQDITEFFEVEILPNGFGAGIEQLIGVLSFGGDAVFTSLADRQIRDGISEFRALQRSNSKIVRDPIERVVGVQGVQVAQDLQDPTKYYFRANIVTESGKVLTTPTIQIGG